MELKWGWLVTILKARIRKGREAKNQKGLWICSRGKQCIHGTSRKFKKELDKEGAE